jgi:hypothetical protein
LIVSLVERKMSAAVPVKRLESESRSYGRELNGRAALHSFAESTTNRTAFDPGLGTAG